MQERWNEIYQLMEVFFTIISTIFSGFSLFLVWQGFKLAKKFLDQHREKLKLDEFFRYRYNLYWEAEKLIIPIQNILKSDVSFKELKGLTEKQSEYYKYDEELIGSLSSCTDSQKACVMHDRIISNRSAILESLRQIKSILLFADFPELNTSFDRLEKKCLYWPNLFKRQGDNMPTLLEMVGVSTLTPWDIIKESVQKSNSKNSKGPTAKDALRLFPNFEGEYFDEKLTLNTLLNDIEEFQKKIIGISRIKE